MKFVIEIVDEPLALCSINVYGVRNAQFINEEWELLRRLPYMTEVEL